ncbi:MAG: hypothetical protein ABEL97_09015 [Salinibacter sp.]
MMSSARLAAALLSGAVLLSIASCSDPASVGAGLGPDSLSGGDPEIRNIVASSLDTARVPPLTGFAGSLLGQDRTWRVLTGRVDDPLAGSVEAEGYIDFFGSEDRPSTFQDLPASAFDVKLRLRRSYLHGDTTSSLSVQLYDLAENAEMGGAPADTSFAAEATPVRSEAYSVAPTDTLVSLSLPDAWVEEHITTLKDSARFDDGSFDGFRLTTTSGNAVVGYEHGSATLRMASESDTVDFQVQKTFTHVERGQPPTLGEDRLVLQDGVGVGLSMAWTDGRIDSLADANVLLNRTQISVPVDTTLLTPPEGSDFVRPLPSGYRLLATRVEGAPSCTALRLFQIPAREGQCIFPTVPAWVPVAARPVADRAFAVFDRWFTAGAPFSRFRMEITARASSNPTGRATALRGIPSTTPVVIRTDAPTEEALPRAILTVTPL